MPLAGFSCWAECHIFHSILLALFLFTWFHNIITPYCSYFDVTFMSVVCCLLMNVCHCNSLYSKIVVYMLVPWLCVTFTAQESSSVKTCTCKHRKSRSKFFFIIFLCAFEDKIIELLPQWKCEANLSAM